MARKISPALEREVLKKSVAGQSTREIAAWLDAEHGVKVTHQTVANLLRQTQETRADVAKSVVREALVGQLVPDLERLEQIRQEAARRAAKQDDDEVWIKLSKLEAEVIDRKLKASGADAPDESPTAGVRVFLPELES